MESCSNLRKIYKDQNLLFGMAKRKGDTIWGAYHESLEKVLRDTLKKLEEIGVPSPTKKEASALIAYRSENNVPFMSEEQIKKFILKLRGF